LIAVHGPLVADGRPKAWVLDHRDRPLGRDDGEGAIVIDDPLLSRRHAMIEHVRELDGHLVRDLESKNGTFVDGVKVEARALEPGAIVRVGSTLFVFVETDREDEDITPMRTRLELAVELAAETELSVLITGPTGAGKELVAQRIHASSGRAGQLVALNCATFHRELMGSELFGHRKGAFSGADHDRSGAFKSADRGTLFLDEIAELPLEQQPALLRVLEDHRIRAVGSDREIAVDVRVVSATHRDLEAMVEANAFRADLYARIAGFQIEVPGLHRRREEILPLFSEFLGDDSRPLTTAAAEALLLYGWPMNVRELKNTAARIRVYASRLEEIDLPLLPSAIQRPRSEPTPVTSEPRDRPPTKAALEELLVRHRGNVAEVARALGRSRQAVYRFLEMHDLVPEHYRDS
jgi:DNA-binding NtrC family response regulator